MLVLCLQLAGQLVDILGVLVRDLLRVVPRILHLDITQLETDCNLLFQTTELALQHEVAHIG